MGYVALFAVATIATYDFFRVLGRIYNFFRKGSPVSPQIFWKTVIRGQLVSSAANSPESTAEYSAFRCQEGDDDDEQSRLVTDTPERYDLLDPSDGREFHDVDVHHRKDTRNDDMTTAVDEKPKSVRMSYMRHSYHSEHSMSSTLRDEPLSPKLSPEPLNRRRVPRHHLHRRMNTMDEFDDDEVADMEDEPTDLATRSQRTLSWLAYIAEWGLVAFAYVELITGTVVYSGICRATYTPGCLAHLISKSSYTQLSRLSSVTKLAPLSRGKHFLPLWSSDILSLFGCIRYVRLGMEPTSYARTWHEPCLALSDCRNDRMQCHLHLRHHQYLARAHGC